jgi:hypothetical protein
MKRRSAPIDENFNELMCLTDQDGGCLARLTRWFFSVRYRLLNRDIVRALSIRRRDRGGK